jgi:flagellar basal body L-ring protein FlgH
MRRLQPGWICGILILLTAMAEGQSLWSPEAQGLLTHPERLRPGDVVVVEVNAATAISFQSLRSDARGLSLELSGGEQGDLFSFLPSATSAGDRSVKGSEELALQTSVGALVREVSPAGMAFIEGTRRVTVENREESVTITGWLHPADLGSGRKVEFGRLADSRIVFQSLLQPSRPTLARGDLVEVRPAPPPAAASPVAGGGAAPATAAPGPDEPPVPQLQLSEGKRRELLLQYLNRIVDILFQ